MVKMVIILFHEHAQRSFWENFKKKILKVEKTKCENLRRIFSLNGCTLFSSDNTI